VASQRYLRLDAWVNVLLLDGEDLDEHRDERPEDEAADVGVVGDAGLDPALGVHPLLGEPQR
jgi:hypothetical protein